MESFLIKGGNSLNGSVKIKAAKNSVLPIMAASILCKGKVVLENIPVLTDITNMCKILRVIGCNVKRIKDKLYIDSSNANRCNLPGYLTSKLRASIFLMGPLISLFKKASVSYPGGCNIGNRPIDIHLNSLKKLGVKINEEHGFLKLDATDIHSEKLDLRFPSVGATENIIMASVFNNGETVIYNCAKEPEIVDLQNFLNQMGAKIEGAGTSVIKINGVEKLEGIKYAPIPDRIVAGTYLIAVLICGGNVEFSNVKKEHLQSLLNLLKGNNCNISFKNDKMIVQSNKRMKSIPLIETNPYPAFPTDLQAQIMTLQTISDGVSIINENMFETRFKHVPELVKMGAKITIKNNCAIIKGVDALSNAEVKATDLRAGASLVLAGLKADGYTFIDDIYHIDRGYDHIERDLQLLGANIRRVDA